PVLFEEMDPLLLTAAADGLLEIDCLSYCLLDAEAPGTERLELPDVAAVRLAIAKERPYFGDLILLNPHHSAADGRAEKFMKARPEIIAVQVGDFKVEQRKGVRAVY